MTWPRVRSPEEHGDHGGHVLVPTVPIDFPVAVSNSSMLKTQPFPSGNGGSRGPIWQKLNPDAPSPLDAGIARSNTGRGAVGSLAS